MLILFQYVEGGTKMRKCDKVNKNIYIPTNEWKTNKIRHDFYKKLHDALMIYNSYPNYVKDNRVALINKSVRIKLSYLINELTYEHNILIRLNWASYIPMSDVIDIEIF